MFAQDLIQDTIPPLKPNDSGLKALNWMSEFKVMHLPVVNKGEYLGLVAEGDILDLNTPEEPLENHKVSLMRPQVSPQAHILEIMTVVAQMQLTLIPVISEEGLYLGNISANYLVQKMATIFTASSPGGILVLEIPLADYSLAQIGQIVEGNDAKIISLLTNFTDNPNILEVTLKLNVEDLSRILQTFDRYKYNVVAKYHTSIFTEDLKDRYDMFMNYINM